MVNEFFTKYLQIGERLVCQMEVHLVDDKIKTNKRWLKRNHLDEIESLLYDPIKARMEEKDKNDSQSQRILTGKTIRLGYMFKQKAEHHTLLLPFKNRDQNGGDFYSNAHSVFREKVVVFISILQSSSPRSVTKLAKILHDCSQYQTQSSSISISNYFTKQPSSSHSNHMTNDKDTGNTDDDVLPTAPPSDGKRTAIKNLVGRTSKAISKVKRTNRRAKVSQNKQGVASMFGKLEQNANTDNAHETLPEEMSVKDYCSIVGTRESIKCNQPLSSEDSNPLSIPTLYEESNVQLIKQGPEETNNCDHISSETDVFLTRDESEEINCTATTIDCVGELPVTDVECEPLVGTSTKQYSTHSCGKVAYLESCLKTLPNSDLIDRDNLDHMSFVGAEEFDVEMDDVGNIQEEEIVVNRHKTNENSTKTDEQVKQTISREESDSDESLPDYSFVAFKANRRSSIFQRALDICENLKNRKRQSNEKDTIAKTTPTSNRKRSKHVLPSFSPSNSDDEVVPVKCSKESDDRFIVDDNMNEISSDEELECVILSTESDSGDIDSQIRNVGRVSNLEEEQLKYLVVKNKEYLKMIFQGCSDSQRHLDYKEGGRKRKLLNHQVHLGLFTENQQDVVMETLMSIFCKKHHNYLEYVMKVLLPEMLIKVHMEVHNTSHAESEFMMKDALCRPGGVFQ